MARGVGNQISKAVLDNLAVTAVSLAAFSFGARAIAEEYGWSDGESRSSTTILAGYGYGGRPHIPRQLDTKISPFEHKERTIADAAHLLNAGDVEQALRELQDFFDPATERYGFRLGQLSPEVSQQLSRQRDAILEKLGGGSGDRRDVERLYILDSILVQPESLLDLHDSLREKLEANSGPENTKGVLSMIRQEALGYLISKERYEDLKDIKLTKREAMNLAQIGALFERDAEPHQKQAHMEYLMRSVCRYYQLHLGLGRTRAAADLLSHAESVVPEQHRDGVFYGMFLETALGAQLLGPQHEALARELPQMARGLQSGNVGIAAMVLAQRGRSVEANALVTQALQEFEEFSSVIEQLTVVSESKDKGKIGPKLRELDLDRASIDSGASKLYRRMQGSDPMVTGYIDLLNTFVTVDEVWGGRDQVRLTSQGEMVLDKLEIEKRSLFGVQQALKHIKASPPDDGSTI